MFTFYIFSISTNKNKLGDRSTYNNNINTLKIAKPQQKYFKTTIDNQWMGTYIYTTDRVDGKNTTESIFAGVLNFSYTQIYEIFWFVRDFWLLVFRALGSHVFWLCVAAQKRAYWYVLDMICSANMCARVDCAIAYVAFLRCVVCLVALCAFANRQFCVSSTICA